jgi:S-DNA-T family DNA segregation ATPase FtsK/SpoIIIE
MPMAKQNTIRNNKADAKSKKTKASKPSSKKSEKPLKKKKSPNATIAKITSFFKDERLHKTFGLLLLLTCLYLFLAFTSYLFSWKNDQGYVKDINFWSFIFSGEDLDVRNWLGRFGAMTSHRMIYGWFGIASFLIPFNLVIWGIRVLFKKSILPIGKTLSISILSIVWLSISLGFSFKGENDFMGGVFGLQTSGWVTSAIGGVGMIFFIIFTALISIVILFNPKIPSFGRVFSKKDEHLDEESMEVGNKVSTEQIIRENSAPEIDLTENTESGIELETENPITEEPEEIIEEGPEDLGTFIGEEESTISTDEFEVEVAEVEEVLSEDQLDDKLKEFGPYDPKLDLSSYQLPGLDLLADHGGGNISVNKQELEDNKNKIVETLNNYKIKIAKIKATIGPTVTLYEIVPAAGVRISKIKNLEDDIALSLAALGIRIIAPMPGRGTIGIEVPNSDPDVVSMRSLIASDKFQNNDMELPIALGKTIANETLVADLAKMPHLLMAGATGQGKSVGLNAILVSILYKKHPSQVKFVLVDPKKVELTLFTKIERHFLAKLPDDSDAIITDTSQVVTTLNSLCVEMDQRYDLLKDAMVRNIKEYNKKFIDRKLNPEKGHKYLPYIILVIDEFADLIMTAGKEVETPIARLAQLARAIGIHLIVATQRPSVNVITGIIKANFPARIAFRVTSKIDSRTILDSGGADQLIGKGDLLYSPGNELIRLQCGFVDTPEVDDITDFIGSQRGYPSAYHLPEYVEETGTGNSDIDLDERDSMFEQAAEVIVTQQQGSASLLQRKLKLGYNRAGRIVDQLEAAGIIGPHRGSKARDVLVPDIDTLHRKLDHERQDKEAGGSV